MAPGGSVAIVRLGPLLVNAASLVSVGPFAVIVAAPDEPSGDART